MKQLPSAIVEVTRGVGSKQFVESLHKIDIVVADADGNVVKSYGDPKRGVFPRSAIKALQALPLIETGAADAFGFENRHLALACSSHNGEEIHTKGTSEMFQKAGLEPICLECGAQLPARSKDRNALAREGLDPSPLHNNCSGKHAGFLAVAAHEKIETSNYIKREHPIQKMVANVLAEVTGAIHSDDNYGIDGCSIPSYEIPFENLAIAYAKFGVGQDPSKSRSKAMLRLRDACLAHPEMVAGSKRFDTQIMQTLGNRAFTKTGAEGVFTAALPELGVGIALKCHDGTTRAAEVACATMVESLLELSKNESNALKRLTNPILKNWNGIEVGGIRMAL